MKCLVCAGAASDRTPPNFDGYVIECPSCGNYEVAGEHGRGSGTPLRRSGRRRLQKHSRSKALLDGRLSRAPRFDPEKHSRWDAQGSGSLQRSTRSAPGT